MLAEAVGPDADALTVIILIFLGLVALTAVLALLGGVWAYRTGRGSARARVGWICIGSVEVLALLLGTPALVKGGVDLLLLSPAVALAVQAALYLLGRATRRPPPPPAGHPGAPTAPT